MYLKGRMEKATLGFKAAVAVFQVVGVWFDFDCLECHFVS